MFIQDEMTPELWQKLEEISEKGFLIECGYSEPTWLRSLERMEYVDHQNWGAGGRYERYTITEVGSQALASYKAGQG